MEGETNHDEEVMIHLQLLETGTWHGEEIMQILLSFTRRHYWLEPKLYFCLS